MKSTWEPAEEEQTSGYKFHLCHEGSERRKPRAILRAWLSEVPTDFVGFHVEGDS